MKYVAGFLFNESRDNIVLIEKLKPAYQKGKLNGVGGKVEPGESPSTAMVREFQEEGGVWIGPHEWELFCEYSWKEDYKIYYYRCFNNDYYDMARTVEEEEITKIRVNTLEHYDRMHNLDFLIPLARNVEIDYTSPLIITETDNTLKGQQGAE